MGHGQHLNLNMGMDGWNLKATPVSESILHVSSIRNFGVNHSGISVEIQLGLFEKMLIKIVINQAYFAGIKTWTDME